MTKMTKRLIVLFLMAGALFSLGLQSKNGVGNVVAVRFATVSRHNVRQVKAITGRLCYADEQYLSASTTGMISKVYVQTGQRVAANDALMRLKLSSQAVEVPALLTNEVVANAMANSGSFDPGMLVSQKTVRSAENCTVRQVLVQEGSAVTMGTPLLKLSSQEQIVRCSVHHTEAEAITPGQWAWIYADGESLGIASVTDVSIPILNTSTGSLEAAVILQPSVYLDLPEYATVDAEIYLSGSDQVLSLPVEAITERNTVWWVNQGKCTEIPAEIVMSDEMYAWVNLPEGLVVAIGELKEGQRVVEALK